MNQWYIVYANQRKEANHGRSHHYHSIPDTGPALGISAAVTDAAPVTHA